MNFAGLMNMLNIEIYNRELEWIFNQFPSYQKVGGRAYKPGIETMKEFDARFGYPHKKFMTIHIAGTNGKGSVSHMLASALASAGLKVGLYTSPHLMDFRERIKINGEMISRERVFDFLTEWKEFMLEQKPSFFEITTAMAFDYFAKERVDIAVIETGLGGRLDSTNVITPILSIITNIALDHCEHLGYTLPEIAVEKAGIIKPEVPVVVGEVTGQTRPVFEAIAGERNSLLIFAQESRFKDVLATDYKLDLKGDYQTHNIRTVLAALYVLGHNQHFLAKAEEGWRDENLRDGISNAAKNTSLRGRWEQLNSDPLVICDTGHNANGLRVVFSQLRRQKADRLFIVIGFVAEKDLEKIFGYMPKNAYYFFTQASTERALSAQKLAEKCKSLGFEGEIHMNVGAALEAYKRIQKAGDLLFIGGSTFIVADAINFLENRDNFFAD